MCSKDSGRVDFYVELLLSLEATMRVVPAVCIRVREFKKCVPIECLDALMPQSGKHIPGKLSCDGGLEKE